MSKKTRFITTLFDEYSQIMVQTAYRYTGSYEIAEELVQEAFLTLSIKYDRVREHENSAGWLFTTLNYLLRRETNKKSYKEITSEIPFLENKAGPVGGSENSLMEILPDKLPSQDVVLLKWIYEDELTYEEISTRLGISTNACRNRLHRLLIRIKNIFNFA